MHSQSVQNFVDETYFIALSPDKVRKLSARRFKAIFDCLEDWNHHTANLLFVALRRGNDDQIERGRELLRLVESAGFLSSEADSLYYSLLRELFPSPEIARQLAEARANAAKLDELGEPFPDVDACLAAGQSPEFLATSTREALADVVECIPTIPARAKPGDDPAAMLAGLRDILALCQIHDPETGHYRPPSGYQITKICRHALLPTLSPTA